MHEFGLVRSGKQCCRVERPCWLDRQIAICY
jgi:hypothetical protein